MNFDLQKIIPIQYTLKTTYYYTCIRVSQTIDLPLGSSLLCHLSSQLTFGKTQVSLVENRQ